MASKRTLKTLENMMQAASKLSVCQTGHCAKEQTKAAKKNKQIATQVIKASRSGKSEAEITKLHQELTKKALSSKTTKELGTCNLTNCHDALVKLFESVVALFKEQCSTSKDKRKCADYAKALALMKKKKEGIALDDYLQMLEMMSLGLRREK